MLFGVRIFTATFCGSQFVDKSQSAQASATQQYTAQERCILFPKCNEVHCDYMHIVLISCTMLLLQQKADISVNIYIVPDPPEQDDEDKDEAAATAPAATNKSSRSSESVDMENDDRDDDASEHSSSSSEGSDGEEAETKKKKKKKKKKKPAWIWQPMKAKEKSKQIVSYSVFQVWKSGLFSCQVLYYLPVCFLDLPISPVTY